MTIPFGINLNRTLQSAAIGLTSWIALSSAALAGNPDVAQEGSTLYIVGDDDGNTVTIVGAEDTPGKLAVYIHNDPWTYEGVDEINIDLAGGDNELRMARIDIAGNLTILTDDGDNRLSLGEPDNYGASFIGGDIEISTGDGPDAISIDDTWVGGNVTVDSRDGTDHVNLGAPLYFTADPDTKGVTILGELTISTGAGTDYIWIMRTSVLGHTQITTAQNQDRVALGFDPAVLPIRNQRRGKATTTNTFLGLTIETGDEYDDVALMSNDIYMDTRIELGNGDDTLSFEAGNRFNGPVEAYGQGGQDTLEEDPDNDYAVPPEFNSFEL